jgi:CRISPR-associated protein Cas6
MHTARRGAIRQLVVIDMVFDVHGSELPVDHGYALFSAISHIIPGLHADESVGIHPINGLLAGNRLMHITRNSKLVIRISNERVRDIMQLSGKSITVDGHKISIGLPVPHMLRPAPVLQSRLVVIKGFLDADSFLDACRRQLTTLGISADAEIPYKQSAHSFERKKGSDGTGNNLMRRTLRIHNKIIVGYAVRVKNLNTADSIRLQEAGLGGRRRFGVRDILTGL